MAEAMTPLERAAKAAAEREGWRWDDDKQMLDRASDLKANTSRERDVWRARVRTVLESLREPTPEMTVIGWKEADKRDAILGNGEIAAIWRAMIDEALK